MKSRFDDHISRKLFHMLSGTIAAYFFAEILTRIQSVVIVFAATIFLGSFDLLRLQWPRLNRLVLKVMGPLMRENELRQPSAQFYYCLGLVWIAVFLPKTLGVQALLILAWMDPIAGIVGVRFGKHSWNEVLGVFLLDSRRIPISLGAKTVEGSLAGFVAAFLAGFLAWTWAWSGSVAGFQPEIGTALLMSAIGAFVAVLAEAWPSQWDDNALIPFWCGLFLYAAVTVLGIPLSFH